MLQVKNFTFNPVQENTYVLYDETGEGAIVDCGCMSSDEEDTLRHFVEDQGIRPVLLLNTHLHFDHVWGNAWAMRTWPEMKAYCHQADLAMPPKPSEQLRLFGIQSKLENLPNEAYTHVDAGAVLRFGNTALEVLYVPGHAPGHIAFFCRDEKVLFSGDALFFGGIGRTDLWGGSYDQLIESIRSELFTLPDDTKVYTGHGPVTTIGWEKVHNPYFF